MKCVYLSGWKSIKPDEKTCGNEETSKQIKYIYIREYSATIGCYGPNLYIIKWNLYPSVWNLSWLRYMHHLEGPCCAGLCVLTQLCPTLCRLKGLWTLIVHQDSLSMEISRQEYWNELPFPAPGNLPNPGIEPASLSSPALEGRFFITEPSGKPHINVNKPQKQNTG